MKKYLSLLIVFSMLCAMLTGFFVKAEISVSEPVTAETVQSTAAHGSDVLITAGKDPSCYNLTWTSDIDGQEYVQWTETDKLINGTMPSDCNVMTAIKEEATTCVYTVRGQMTDLESDTSYSYCVGSDTTGWSPIYTFDLSDKTDGSFSFILAGDPQIGASSVSTDTKGWNTTLAHVENWFGDDIDFLMTAGDHVNKHSTTAQYQGFADPDWLRSNVILGAPGNHDNGVGYSEHFTYTGNDSGSVAGGGTYAGDYWVEYEGSLIMSLNLNKNSVTTHSAFVRNAVAEYKAIYGEPTWTIVVFHQSIYSAGVRAEDEGNLDKRDRLAPVFSEVGVDAVLAGHDHVYTRAYMINGNTVIDNIGRYTNAMGDPYGSYHNPAEGDVFYLTANSSSGSKYYELYASQMPFAYVTSEENIPTVTKVDVTESSMTYTTYYVGADNTIGDIMDFFAIHRDTEADTTPPTLNVPTETYFTSVEELDLTYGVTAYDNVDKELTDSITISGKPDMRGVTTVTYTVTDKAGNTTVKERKLIPITESTVMSESKTVWSYWDEIDAPAGDWNSVDYDDSTWKTATGSFGSKNGAIAKIGSYTPANLLQQYYPEGHANAGENIPNYFFRAYFDVDDPETVAKLYSKINYDDGCNVYINGVLAQRFNTDKIGEGLGYNGKTSSNAQAGYIDVSDKELLEAFNLKKTGNVIAVQLYQSDLDSSDVFFRLKNFIVSSITTAPFATSEGVQVTMHNIKDVKDIFIAEGDYDSYRDVKNNLIVQLTQNKLKGQNEYTYVVPRHGIHTVYIRYDDGSYVISKTDVTGAEPEYTVNGLQLTVNNLENIKVIRTAYGEYTSVSAMKRAETHRAFTAKNDIKGKDSYMIQYRENGAVTVAVCYNDGYTEFYTYTVEKKTPTMEQNGATVTFGSLDGLYNIRYAKGEYATSSEIKKAPGAVALKPSSIDENGNITVVLSTGTYTFCVQYDDESYNYYTVTVEKVIIEDTDKPEGWE
ncbi:MAG: metallophosphoesterase [Clostridia bacterium]|nr:metallophosphoesterase [Clostridia bacterium]